MSSLTNQVPIPVSTAATAASKSIATLASKPLIASAASAVSSNAVPISEAVEVGETCTLLPGLFGVTIQLLLCATSIAIVFMKYAFETPKRPYNVFMMDFITLMCGSGTVHVLNIFSSILINRYQGASPDQGDECNLYFMTTLFDATFGVYIEYKIVRYLAIRKAAHNYLQLTRKSVFQPTTQELADATRIATVALTSSSRMETYAPDIECNAVYNHSDEDHLNRSHDHSVSSGRSGLWQHFVFMVTSPGKWIRNLGNDEFLDNLTTWLAIVCGLKLFTIALFTVFSSRVNSIGNFLLYFFQKRHHLKLLFVMIAAPLVFNVFQYCVTDSIMKIKTIDQQHFAAER